MIPLRDTIPSRQAPVVTWALISANVLVFLYELTLRPEELEGLFYLFGLVPARYSHPEWALMVGFPIDDYWPFVTCMFLHGGWGHIGADVLQLMSLYPQPVKRQPSVEYLPIQRQAPPRALSRPL